MTDSTRQIRRDVLREIVAENPLTAEVGRRISCVWKAAQQTLEDYEAIGLDLLGEVLYLARVWAALGSREEAALAARQGGNGRGKR
jgi:hypothetical protein